MGDGFAPLFECSVNFPFASYLDRKCMHSGRMSQYHINITRNTSIAKTSQSCNGPAVRIKGNQSKGKNTVESRQLELPVNSN